MMRWRYCMLAPHMTAAVRVYNRVGDLEDQVESLEVALGQFAIGVGGPRSRGAGNLCEPGCATAGSVAKNGLLLQQGGCARRWQMEHAAAPRADRTRDREWGDGRAEGESEGPASVNSGVAAARLSAAPVRDDMEFEREGRYAAFCRGGSDNRAGAWRTAGDLAPDAV